MQTIIHSKSRLSILLRWSGLALILLVVGIIVLNPFITHAATWSSTSKWGTVYLNGYKIQNEVWGSKPGPQTIWANSGNNWGIWANHVYGNGVESYANSGLDIKRNINSLQSVSSNFNVSIPKSGAFETAYDIWLNNSTYEVMLWLNKTGAIGPIGTYQRSVTVGNYSWNVYKGSNGKNAVFSFLNTGSATKGTVNVLSVLKWIEYTAKWYGNPSLTTVQFGFEISGTNGGSNFTSNYNDVSYK